MRDENVRDDVEILRQRAEALFRGAASMVSQLVSPRPGLHVLRQAVPTAFDAHLYEPTFCLVLQGRKEMVFADRKYRIRAGECALVSHDLPIVSRVGEAPYLVVLLSVRGDVLRGIYEEVGELATQARANAVEVDRAEPRLLDAVGRYLALSEAEGEARVLGPTVLREIHYRLLVSPIGHMLRNLLRFDSHASSIARAITLLRRDFRRAMLVEELARATGQSVSAFHRHFKAVTSLSPLQYQKDLRLLEARRQLTAGSASVTAVAFDVGYESASQFSREYARKFGHPPSHDVRKDRTNEG